MNSQPQINRLATTAALITVALWASAFVGIRAVSTDLSPGSLALGRLAIGTVALGILVAVKGWTRPTRREIVLIAGSGLIWFSIYNVALNTAEQTVEAGTASMLVATAPILIALLAGTFLGEGYPPRILIGCAIAFAGAVAIAFGASSGGSNSVVGPVGIALCLVAALAYAAGITLQKPALRRVPALQVTWLACTFGTMGCLPFGPTLLAELPHVDAGIIGWLVYLGLGPTAIAFTTWAFALSRTTTGRLGSTSYLVPPIAVAISWALLGEIPHPLAMVGGTLCVTGVIVARSTALPFRLGPFRRPHAGP
jgi:drug/metabolite transporter (DMT)-like permease